MTWIPLLFGTVALTMPITYAAGCMMIPLSKMLLEKLKECLDSHNPQELPTMTFTDTDIRDDLLTLADDGCPHCGE